MHAAQLKARRRAAAAAARDLGRLRPVLPSRRTPDGMPLLEVGQVYATPFGEVFHPVPCEVVGQLWDAEPFGLLVIEREQIGRRTCCPVCAPGGE
ncbi:hypothetical protein [Pseudactinotalea terrae]|uniref:hypothetical protein n=1 Tax=Pseudactinotalea terrae TaxID=1743262 RepID=UPI0012E30E7F|nr:hypothetical protein [Pseudactinotalea terrae]